MNKEQNVIEKKTTSMWNFFKVHSHDSLRNSLKLLTMKFFLFNGVIRVRDAYFNP